MTHQKTLIHPIYTKKPYVNYYLCSFVKLIQSVEYCMNICVVIKEGYTDLHSYIVIWIHMLKYREIKVFSMILIIHVFTNNNILPVSCICYTYPHRNFQNPSKKYPLISLHPDISMHILYTVLYTFLSILTRRICLTIKSFIGWWSFPLFSWPQCAIQGWYCKEKLDAGHS